MALPIVFNNAIFPTARWGLVTQNGSQYTVTQQFSQAVVTGTVTAAGDEIQLTISSSGTIIPLDATSFDTANAMVFEDADNAGVFYILSLANLAINDVVTFNESNLGDFAPCFAAGTRILTRHGEVAVEDLWVGDEALALLGGGLARIAWIGKREVVFADLRQPAALWPLRVQADAFAPGRPHSDLYLSPDHAVHVDGVLIPIRYLENGTTITRTPVDRVTYYHIELDRHDVLLAEGLPSESYLDTGNRADFAGVSRDAARVLQDERAARAVWAERACAPLHVSGRMVHAARRRLAERAVALGHDAPAESEPQLRVDGAVVRGIRDGNTWHFELPSAVAGARLASDCFVPAVVLCDSIDQRCLGLPVARLVIDGEAVALADFRLNRAGWHRPEGGLRWTNGDAVLPEMRTLSVTLAPAARQLRWMSDVAQHAIA